MIREILERTENQYMNGWGLFQVITIYNAIYCPICDQKQPHVELQHRTGNNASPQKNDDHRRATSLNCLGHCDTDLLPEKVIAETTFYDKNHEWYYHFQLRHKSYGRAGCHYIGKTSTDSYFYDFKTSQDKAGKHETLSHRGGCGPATDYIKEFPFAGTQRQKNYHLMQVMSEHYDVNTPQPPKPGEQLELF